jgi:hypothetical protein
VAGFALWDILGTVIAAWIVSHYFRQHRITFTKALIGLALLGVFLHWLFCVPTTLNTLLGLV